MSRTILRCKDLDRKYKILLGKLSLVNKRSLKTLDGLFRVLDSFLSEYDFVRPLLDVSISLVQTESRAVLKLYTIDTDLSPVLPPVELAGFEEKIDGTGYFESSGNPIVSGSRLRNGLLGLVVFMSSKRRDLLPATGNGSVVKVIRESLGTGITEVSLSDTVSLYYSPICHGRCRIIVAEPTRSGITVKSTTYESTLPNLISADSRLRIYNISVSRVSRDYTGLLDAAYELTEKLNEEN